MNAGARAGATGPRIAALLVLVLLAVLWGGLWLRQNTPNGQILFGQGVDTTGAMFITPVALAAALGLWLRTTWGWWLSLIAVSWEFIAYTLFLVVTLATEDRTGLLTWSTAAVLLVLLVTLLLPAVRNACLDRQPAG